MFYYCEADSDVKPEITCEDRAHVRCFGCDIPLCDEHREGIGFYDFCPNCAAVVKAVRVKAAA